METGSVPIFDLIQSPYEILNNYHKLSIARPNEFWKAQAKLINWFKYPENICDYTNPPYCDWFADGKTNLCLNAVDRHLAERGKQKAVIFKSSETNEEETYSYNQLYSASDICKNFNTTKGSKRRQSNYLYADDSRGDLCNAGMRKNWSNTFCRFWWLFSKCTRS